MTKPHQEARMLEVFHCERPYKPSVARNGMMGTKLSWLNCLCLLCLYVEVQFNDQKPRFCLLHVFYVSSFTTVQNQTRMFCLVAVLCFAVYCWTRISRISGQQLRFRPTRCRAASEALLRSDGDLALERAERCARGAAAIGEKPRESRGEWFAAAKRLALSS